VSAYPFVQARNYRKGGNLPVNRLVLHSMEAPEKGDTAEAVARYFASGAVVASCHYMCDNDSIVAGVHEEDTAYHAPPNAHSIGIEHAGYARQSAAEWADPYSEAMLRRSATLAADICRRHDLPVTFVTAADLLAGKRGITTHVEVSRAWRQSDHTDPGPNFPMAHYLDLVHGASGPTGVKPMYSPALALEPIVADLACPTGGAWLLAASGAVYAFGGAPYRGSPAGKDYFAGRKAARLNLVDGSYQVVAESGELYGPVFP